MTIFQQICSNRYKHEPVSSLCTIEIGLARFNVYIILHYARLGALFLCVYSSSPFIRWISEAKSHTVSFSLRSGQHELFIKTNFV